MVAVFPWLVCCTGFDGYRGRPGNVRQGPVDGRRGVREDRIVLTPLVSPSQHLEGLLWFEELRAEDLSAVA